MKIKYGVKNRCIDVTDICMRKLMTNNMITIPSGDRNRSQHFTDPKDGSLKKIFVILDNNVEYEYDASLMIRINVIDEMITIINMDEELTKIHNKLYLKHGNFEDELPEQKMVFQYITGNEKILEIGGNIGRNSLVIGHILDKKKNNNFVSLESDTLISNQLVENRDLNNLHFHVENSALSKRALIQKDWDTIVSDVLLEGYKKVNIISLEDLSNKYEIEFDTLIIDCEGAFYNILIDMPELLDNINLIIMENDYSELSHKEFVDKTLKNKGFYVDYVEEGGCIPCYSFFYEVWKRNIVA